MTAARGRPGPAGVKVLVAVGVARRRVPDDPGRCLEGELCWVVPPGADASRGPGRPGFAGASTGGRTTGARVDVLADATRLEVLRTLRDAATPLLGPVLAQRAAATTLAAAAALPTGTVVTRDPAAVSGAGSAGRPRHG